MSNKPVTRQQQSAITDFVSVARTNGLVNIWACLPRNHPLIANNSASQIRRVTDALAEGWDELGNRVRLTPDLRVIQG